MATTTRPWTRDELERLPDDGNRYEVLDGQLLVTPQAAFDHQGIAVALLVALHPWCVEHGIGNVVGPGAVVFGKNELQPDVQVVPLGDYPRGVKWDALPQPLLVIEVRSESTYRRDVGIKREAYMRIGIPEYWVVDPQERVVLVWRAGADEPERVTDTLRWRPNAELPPLEIPLVTFLGPATAR